MGESDTGAKVGGTRILAAFALVILVVGIVVGVVRRDDTPPAASTLARDSAVAPSPTISPSPSPAPTPTPTPTPPPRPSPEQIYAAAGLRVPSGPVAREGCPPPPPDPAAPGEGRPAWKPPVTVPEDELPAAIPAPERAPSVAPFEGRGMWIWQYSKTEGGDYARIVERAAAAGLSQLWVRVGDSRDGFYAARHLHQLVPLAHEHGLDVVGWGFPFLHDPVADARWSEQAIAWRGPDGRGLDGFSPDIEMETENVELSDRRVEVYLGLVRQAAGELPLAATVYPPADWVLEAGYPYETMSPYVDAFVPMAYWMCEEPGEYAATSVRRLRDLRPVHVIGQAFSNKHHERRIPPSAEETYRFLDTAAGEGAVGASLWVWQEIGEAQWNALASFPWREIVDARTASRPVD